MTVNNQNSTFWFLIMVFRFNSVNTLLKNFVEQYEKLGSNGKVCCFGIRINVIPCLGNQSWLADVVFIFLYRHDISSVEVCI